MERVTRWMEILHLGVQLQAFLRQVFAFYTLLLVMDGLVWGSLVHPLHVWLVEQPVQLPHVVVIFHLKMNIPPARIPY